MRFLAQMLAADQSNATLFLQNSRGMGTSQRTFPRRVRVKFARRGHEKFMKQPRKRRKHCFSFQADEGHEKVTSQNFTSNEKSSEPELVRVSLKPPVCAAKEPLVVVYLKGAWMRCLSR